MSKGEKLMLHDAIKTAIENEKRVIRLKIAIAILSVLYGVTFAVLMAMYLM